MMCLLGACAIAAVRPGLVGWRQRDAVAPVPLRIDHDEPLVDGDPGVALFEQGGQHLVLDPLGVPSGVTLRRRQQVHIGMGNDARQHLVSVVAVAHHLVVDALNLVIYRADGYGGEVAGPPRAVCPGSIRPGFDLCLQQFRVSLAHTGDGLSLAEFEQGTRIGRLGCCG